jgi:PPOX class probable F420-dependent enzyme
MEIPQSVRDLLATGPLGHLVTLDPDGNPHVTLVWAGFDGDELVFATFPDQHKLESIRRDPRVVVACRRVEHWSGWTTSPRRTSGLANSSRCEMSLPGS